MYQPTVGLLRSRLLVLPFTMALLALCGIAGAETGASGARPSRGSATRPGAREVSGLVFEAAGLEPSAVEEILAHADAALYLPAEGRVRWLSATGSSTLAVPSAVVLTEQTFAAFEAGVETDFPGVRSRTWGPFLLKLPGSLRIDPSLVAATPPSTEHAAAPAPQSVAFTDSFEGSLAANWLVTTNWTSDMYKWGTTSCDAHSGSRSVDAVRGGTVGSTLACDAVYPNGTRTGMLHSACEGIQGAAEAWLDVYMKSGMESSTGGDYVFFGYPDPTNPSAAYGYYFFGSWTPWFHLVFNLKQWVTLGDLTSQSCPKLYVEFGSDAQYAVGFGVRLDDLRIATDHPSFLSVSATPNPSSGPAPLTVNFTANVSGSTGGEAYAWLFGDAAQTTSSLRNPAFTYTAPGYYDAWLWVTDSSRNGARAVTRVHVAAPPSCQVACTASSPATGIAGRPVSFQGGATPSNCSASPVYSWSFGDQQSSTAQNPTHTYASAGTYYWSMLGTVGDFLSGGGICSKGGWVTIEPARLTTLPGDCDGNGGVTIGEVENALLMLLGVLPPGCNVDTNRDGRVTAGELQAVIDSFLVAPAVAVKPSVAVLTTGQRQRFAATVLGSPATGISWSVQEGAAGGSITADGVYTAPALPGTFHVVAASAADPSKKGVAFIGVQGVPAPGLSLQAPLVEAPLVPDIEWTARMGVIYTGAGLTTYALAAGPTGMTVGSLNGTVKWTPPRSAAGTSSHVTVTATDGTLSAQVSFDLPVASSTSLATSLSGSTLTVTQPGTLNGLTLTFPADFSVTPSSVRLGLVSPDQLPPLPTGVTRLTDVFIATPASSPGSFITVSIPAALVPSGRKPWDLRVYSYAPRATDIERPFWIPTQWGLDVLPGGVVKIHLASIGERTFVGIGPYVPPPARRSQVMVRAPSAPSPLASVTCHAFDLSNGQTPDVYDVCLADGEEPLWVFIKGLDSAQWTPAATPEELTGWLVDAKNTFRPMFFSSDQNIEVSVETINPNDPRLNGPALGFASSTENYSVLHLNKDPATKDTMKVTTVHEFFHHAQARTPYGSGWVPLSASYPDSAWVVEGTAQWFEDEVYDTLDSYRASEPQPHPNILEAGLNARPATYAAGPENPYSRFAFHKMLRKKCQPDTLFRLMQKDANDTDGSGLASLDSYLGGGGCDFGRIFGTANRGTLAAALGFYSFATIQMQDLSLLDPNESDFPFGGVSGITPAADCTDQVPCDTRSAIALSLPPGSARSVNVWPITPSPGSGGVLWFDGASRNPSTWISVNAWGNDLPPASGGSATVGALTSTWLKNTDAATYVFAPGQSGQAPATPMLFLTAVNPSTTTESWVRVRAGLQPPDITITGQPSDTIVTEGDTATFSVTATSATNKLLTYQWLKNGSVITGPSSSSSSYTTPATVLADSGSRFSVVVSDSADSRTSAPALLTVNPRSTAHPIAVFSRTVIEPLYSDADLTVSGATATGVTIKITCKNGSDSITSTFTASWSLPAGSLAPADHFRGTLHASVQGGSMPPSSSLQLILGMNGSQLAGPGITKYDYWCPYSEQIVLHADTSNPNASKDQAFDWRFGNCSSNPAPTSEFELLRFKMDVSDNVSGYCKRWSDTYIVHVYYKPPS